jgi:hypothetical protein
MRSSSVFGAALTLAASAFGAVASNCSGGDALAVKGGVGHNVDGAIVFSTQGLQVDADGAPNSYLVDGSGLSPTCDGAVGIVNGRPVYPPAHGWLQICESAWAHAQQTGDYSGVKIFGFLADPRTNVPIVQQSGDPLPGKAYVSTTSLSVSGSPETAQRHWVDAVKIPYFVLPGKFAAHYSIKLGDVAVLYSKSTGKTAFAVFADNGPALGEASVATHLALGGNPMVKSNGVDRAEAGMGGKVVTAVFRGQHANPNADPAGWTQEINTTAAAAFNQWGGIERLKSCLP